MVKTSDSNAGPNLPKAQEQARDTVKEGRNTTAAIDHEFDEFTISGGQASKDAAAESMWLLMDKDNSGTISKAEFKSYYEVLHAHVVKEHTQHRSLEEKAKKAQRRSQMLIGIVAVLVLLVSVLLGGNAGLAYYIAQVTKEATVNSNSSLIASDGSSTVATASAVEFQQGGLGTLPSRVGELDFNSIKALTLPGSVDGEGGSMHGVQVVGWTWYNLTAMDLALATGATLRIADGNWSIVPLTSAEGERRLVEADASSLAMTHRHGRELKLASPMMMDVMELDIATTSERPVSPHETPNWRCEACKFLVDRIIGGGACEIIIVEGALCGPPPVDVGCMILLGLACEALVSKLQDFAHMSSCCICQDPSFAPVRRSPSSINPYALCTLRFLTHALRCWSRIISIATATHATRRASATLRWKIRPNPAVAGMAAVASITDDVPWQARRRDASRARCMQHDVLYQAETKRISWSGIFLSHRLTAEPRVCAAPRSFLCGLVRLLGRVFTVFTYVPSHFYHATHRRSLLILSLFSPAPHKPLIWRGAASHSLLSRR